jgi:hypothetical protein
VQLRCYLLSLLRIHQPDCERCAREKRGVTPRRLSSIALGGQTACGNHTGHSQDYGGMPRVIGIGTMNQQDEGKDRSWVHA